jgi:hypothetical protein
MTKDDTLGVGPEFTLLVYQVPVTSQLQNKQKSGLSDAFDASLYQFLFAAR